jgi:hypothetical protein
VSFDVDLLLFFLLCCAFPLCASYLSVTAFHMITSGSFLNLFSEEFSETSCKCFDSFNVGRIIRCANRTRDPVRRDYSEEGTRNM